ncbi:MAG: phosphatidate cytidylyltransferase [Blastocatellia bacterium]|nr:phosphatidate cytidylyltransferase [Blastocatellia bacterium]
MKQRLLTAFIVIPLLVYIIWWGPAWAFNLIVLLAVLIGVREFQLMAEKVGYQGPRWVAWLGSAGVVIGVWLDRPGLTEASLAATMAVGMIAHIAYRHSIETALVSTSATIAGVVYVAVLASYLIRVRMIDNGVTALSAQLLLFFLLVNWAADTSAMLIGKRFGRRPLLPVISPKKTVEGGLGGLLGSLVGAGLAHLLFFPQMPLRHALLLALVMGAVGQVGDWCESLLKRSAKIKDAASILPGHGGMLDRLDSLLFNAPILYYYYRFFWSS